MTTTPTLTPAQPGETPEQYGLRAFAHLVAHPYALTTYTQRLAAAHFSVLLVTAPDVHPAVREQWQQVRVRLARQLAADRRALATLLAPLQDAVEAAAEAQAASGDGGRPAPLSPPPTRPTPPSAAVSPVTGQPLPDAATIAARLAAARAQAVRTAGQNGGAL